MNVFHKKNYRPDIDGLRAVAVLSILFYHLDINGFEGGFVGVDIFFVISGFLITRLIKDEIEKTGRLNLKNFYLRRIRRLFPALFVTLIFTTVFAAILLSPAHLDSFGGSLTTSLLSVSNFYFWLEADYFDVSARVKPLLHTWSLSVEEQFYLFWPIVLYTLYKIKIRWVPSAVLFCGAFLSLFASVTFSDGSVFLIKRYSPTIEYFISNGRSTIFFLFPFRIFEFAIGGLLTWGVLTRKESRVTGELFFLLGIGLITYSVLFFNNSMLFPSYYALVPCIGTVLLLYTGAASFFSILFTNQLLVGIGKISYSLYLVHWPLIVFWSYLKGELGYIDQLVLLSAAIFLAYLSYRYIECPFRYQRVKIVKFKYKFCTGVCVLLVAAVGIHMEKNFGWPWRVSSPVVFENVGDSASFHTSFYGGAGYPFYGPVNSESPPDIVLMGDSHGRHYAEGIYKEWVEPENKSFYMASGASFIHLPFFTRTTEGYDWSTEVNKRMGDALSCINDAGSHPIVIVSHFWLSQMGKADILDKHGKPKNITVGVDEIIQGISLLKQKIGRSPLVIIGEVPGPGHNLYDIFTRPMSPFFSSFDPEDYLNSPANEPRKSFNQKLSDISEATGDFLFLDPYNVLCKEGMCRNTDANNRLIYSDWHHLSKYGSREVIKAFLPMIKELLHTSEIRYGNETTSENGTSNYNSSAMTKIDAQY